MNQFNVLRWDINGNKVEYYDVLPYFRKCYNSCKKKDRPVTRDQWEEFVHDKGTYMFWARCEYEILISQWPPHPSPDKNKHIKMDVWNQINSNLDVVVNLLMSEYNDSTL